MNSDGKFYNNSYSLITKNPFNIKGFDNYTGDLQQIYIDIRNKELLEDRLYLGHIIIKNENYVDKFFLKQIVKNNKLKDNNFFAFDYNHDGIHSDCSIDESIIFCSSFVLPFYIFNYRTSNSLYGDILSRRLKMYKLETLKDLA